MQKKLLFIPLLSLSVFTSNAQNVANPPSNHALITTGVNNTSIGHSSGSSLTTGSGNTHLGFQAGLKGAETSNNVMIGENAGYENLSNGNVFIGRRAGEDNSAGEANVIIGNEAGKNTDKGDENVFIGAGAGEDNDDGGANVFVGAEAGKKNNDGENNIFIGRESGKTIENGNNNVFIGKSAGEESVKGENNTFIGYRAGLSALTVEVDPGIYGAHNVSIGDSSGVLNQGNSNVFLGSLSGASTETGDNNVFIGGGAAAVGANAAGISNSGAIGANAQVAISNAIVIGDTTNNDLKVGIGLASPKHKLDVRGVVNMEVVYNSPAIKINDKQFVGIDKNGDFLLSESKIKYENPKLWSDKVFEKEYELMPLSDLKVYVEENKHLPNIPSAADVVENGVSIHKITSKLLEKIEEQSLYILQLKAELDELKAEVYKK